MRRQAIALTAVAMAAVSSVAAAAPVHGQELPTVAVLDFAGLMMGDGNAAVPLGKTVSAMLVTEFSEREGMQVIERQQLNEMLREQDLALSGRVDESSAIEVGRLLGAQYVLTGQATDIVGNLRMDIRAVDVETSEIVAVLKVQGLTTELFELIANLADDFSEMLDLTPPAERPEMEAIPVPATIAFSRAVAYEDRGEVEQAIDFYEQTLEIHPSHRDAQRALERLRGDGGV
jgi:curli biogenesis system outer membrane secretion channel CsgG